MITERSLTPEKIFELNLAATDPQGVMTHEEKLTCAIVSTLYDKRVQDLSGAITLEHLELLEQHIESLKQKGDLETAEKLSIRLNNKYGPISTEI